VALEGGVEIHRFPPGCSSLHAIFLSRAVLILSSRLRLVLRSDLPYSGFPDLNVGIATGYGPGRPISRSSSPR
jgi:hypothetical protein